MSDRVIQKPEMFQVLLRHRVRYHTIRAACVFEEHRFLPHTCMHVALCKEKLFSIILWERQQREKERWTAPFRNTAQWQWNNYCRGKKKKTQKRNLEAHGECKVLVPVKLWRCSLETTGFLREVIINYFHNCKIFCYFCAFEIRDTSAISTAAWD